MSNVASRMSDILYRMSNDTYKLPYFRLRQTNISRKVAAKRGVAQIEWYKRHLYATWGEQKRVDNETAT